MWCRWLVVAVLVGSSESYADPRFEVAGGISLDHLSGGTCGMGGFNAPCAGTWGPSLELEAGEVFELGHHMSVVAREIAAGGLYPSGALARGYLGLGARAQFQPWLYIELTGGGETMWGDTGTGESGLAGGASLALSPRIGLQLGCWALVLEGVLAPQATGEVGLADYDLGVVVARRVGE